MDIKEYFKKRHLNDLADLAERTGFYYINDPDYLAFLRKNVHYAAQFQRICQNCFGLGIDHDDDANEIICPDCEGKRVTPVFFDGENVGTWPELYHISILRVKHKCQP